RLEPGGRRGPGRAPPPRPPADADPARPDDAASRRLRVPGPPASRSPTGCDPGPGPHGRPYAAGPACPARRHDPAKTVRGRRVARCHSHCNGHALMVRVDGISPKSFAAADTLTGWPGPRAP